MATRKPTKASTTEKLTEIVKVETDEKKELAHKKASYEKIVEELKELVIEDEEDFVYASNVLKTVKTFSKQIEAKRKKVTDPLNAALKEFRGWYKPTMDVLAEGERILKEKIGAHALKKEEEREAQMRAIAKASQEGDFDAAHAASQNIVETPTARGITARTDWDYDVVDFDLVPRDFLCVDHSALKIHMKDAKAAGSDPTEIPGIKFKKKSGVIARTK